MLNNLNILMSTEYHITNNDEELGNVSQNEIQVRRSTRPTNEKSWWDEDTTAKDESYVCIATLILIICLVVIVPCVTLSFHYVNYDEYGIRNNVYKGADLSTVYDQGRYFLTLDNEMLKFPSTYQRIDITSAVFAENGLEFDCVSSFVYRLPKEHLGEIYDTYGMNYDSRVENTASQVIKNVASTFSENEFLSNRTDIRDAIANELEYVIDRDFNIEVPESLFEILSITFPQSVVDIRLETAIALQNNELLEKQQNVNIVIADTNKMKASIDAQTEQTLLFSETRASKLVEDARTSSVQIALTTRGNGISLLCNELNITDSRERVRVVEIFAIMDNGNYTYVNGIDNALIKI